MKLCDGKYEFHKDGPSLYAARYGEPWRNFIGDHAVTALYDIALEALEALAYYRDQCSGAEPSLSVFSRMVDIVLDQTDARPALGEVRGAASVCLDGHEFVEQFHRDFPDTDIDLIDGRPRVFCWSVLEGMPAVRYHDAREPLYTLHLLTKIHDWAAERGWHGETVNPECVDFYRT